MYCTRCGTKLSAAGICPKCQADEKDRVHPMGRTVYFFTESGIFLALTLIWTLATVWNAVFFLRASLFSVVFFLPFVFLCIGGWGSYIATDGTAKRAFLHLMSICLLVITIGAALIFSGLCLMGFYGIFLSASERAMVDSVPALFRLVAGIFLCLPLSLIYLNSLRTVTVTAGGTLRGNRGMPLAPLSGIVLSFVFAVISVFLLFQIQTLDELFSVTANAVSRLPGLTGRLLVPFSEMTWRQIAPALIGTILVFVTTGVTLAMYRDTLSRKKRAIVSAASARPPQQKAAPRPTKPPAASEAEVQPESRDSVNVS